LLIINSSKEFGINKLTNYAKLIGIKILYTAPYTFKQNGPAKYIRGIILGITKLIRIKANLPEYL
jgi:hypothetical protein